MVNFIYPNEAEVLWSMLIIMYPFITGLVAGSFIISTLYYVFNITIFKDTARMALLVSLSFLFTAPMPLLFHLGQPLRALEIFTTPQFGSAMAGFGVIYMTFMIILFSAIWFDYRKDMILFAKSGKGLKKLWYTVMNLGSLNLNEKDFLLDKKIVKYLSIIGIPVGIILTGYVGFLFGGIKASPWWATPLLPVIFLMSGLASGTALVFLMYVLLTKYWHRKLDHDNIDAIFKWLFGFLLIDVSFEILELIFMQYEASESWPFMLIMLTEKLNITFFGVQLIIGGFIPLILIGLVLLLKSKPITKLRIGFFSSCLIIIGVFTMRFNVVIGGQLLSKSLRGFVEYHPEIWGREGLLVAGILIIFPFILFAIFSFILPPWNKSSEEIKKID